MNCLLISTSVNEANRDLELFLESKKVNYKIVNDPFAGIQQAQEHHFDVIIIDAGLEDIQINQTLRILKGSSPASRIIVQSRSNSRDLETAIRKEQVFYYHLNSFGINDLTTAIQSALDVNRI